MNLLNHDGMLLIVDVQQAFDDDSWGQRNNLNAEANIASIVAAWRDSQRPLVHIQHRSQDPSSLFYPDGAGYMFKPEAAPRGGERIIQKSVNSAFIGTNLEEHLRAENASTLVIVGLTTDHCVSTTTRMASNLGFQAILVSDATATFGRRGPNGVQFTAEQIHSTALASLNEEFATVVDTQTLLSMIAPARADAICKVA